MSVLNETAAVLDALRKTIAEHETLIAEGRRKIRKSDGDALNIQAIWENTLNCYKRTLEQIEKSKEVVANSHALLQEMKERHANESATKHTDGRLSLSKA